MKDILLVEDNYELAQLMIDFLKKEGFSVILTGSGEGAMEIILEESVKLVLLDIMLPGIDGFAVCKAIRKKGNVPIVIMSARSAKEDKLEGFQLGADDYIEKPVDIEILAAKARALIARSHGSDDDSNILISGGLTVDKDSRTAYLGEGKLELNVKEFALLSLLIQNPGKTLHKDYLFHHIWGIDSFSENQTLTVHIKMLRSKIEEDPRHPKRIQTVWGVGYRYEKV